MQSTSTLSTSLLILPTTAAATTTTTTSSTSKTHTGDDVQQSTSNFSNASIRSLIILSPNNTTSTATHPTNQAKIAIPLLNNSNRQVVNRRKERPIKPNLSKTSTSGLLVSPPVLTTNSLLPPLKKARKRVKKPPDEHETTQTNSRAKPKRVYSNNGASGRSKKRKLDTETTIGSSVSSVKQETSTCSTSTDVNNSVELSSKSTSFSQALFGEFRISSSSNKPL